MIFKPLIYKYLDVFSYLFFGACTTFVNVFSYVVAVKCFSMHIMYATYVAWFLAVLFAYLTNRKWVFSSNVKGFYSVTKECVSFFLCRAMTGFIDAGIMYLFAVQCGVNDTLVKVVANIIVIVINFLASKFFIFRKDK